MGAKSPLLSHKNHCSTQKHHEEMSILIKQLIENIFNVIKEISRFLLLYNIHLLSISSYFSIHFSMTRD